MKAPYFIIPVAALAAVVAWNVHLSRSVNSVERGTEDLEQTISRQKAKSRPLHPERLASAKERVSAAADVGGSFDWRSISTTLGILEDRVDPAAEREISQLEERLEEMSAAELIAIIDEVQAMGLGKVETARLEEMLISPLIESDPQLALKKFADRIQSDPDGVGWELSTALGEWADADPASATRWLDEQIAAGLFDSKTLDGNSETRLEFEASLISGLFGEDPTSAAKRIEALPEDQRREVLQQISFTDLDASGQQAYTSLLRDLIPESERVDSFSYVVEDLVIDGGFAAVDEFLENVDATAGERGIWATQAATSQILAVSDERAVTREDIDKMRTWLANYAPDEVDQMTGRALADATQDGSELEYAEAARLVGEYHKSSGNDQVIVAFLESFAAHSNLEEALPIAELITDLRRRAEILSQIKQP